MSIGSFVLCIGLNVTYIGQHWMINHVYSKGKFCSDLFLIDFTLCGMRFSSVSERHRQTIPRIQARLFPLLSGTKPNSAE